MHLCKYFLFKGQFSFTLNWRDLRSLITLLFRIFELCCQKRFVLFTIKLWFLRKCFRLKSTFQCQFSNSNWIRGLAISPFEIWIISCTHWFKDFCFIGTFDFQKISFHHQPCCMLMLWFEEVIKHSLIQDLFSL